MKVLLTLLIAIMFESCHAPSKKEHGTSFYADIDIFKMQGRGQLNRERPDPPCFEVDSIAPDRVTLISWYSKIGSSSLNYIKSNNYWATHFNVLSDTLDLIVYHYIGQDRFISLEYQNDSFQDKLKTVSIYHDSVETVSRFKNYLKISPSATIDPGNIPDHDLKEKTINEFHIHNGVLQVLRTDISMASGDTTRDTHSYKIDNHSIFWWREFGR